jgi:hypothetical protein
MKTLSVTLFRDLTAANISQSEVGILRRFQEAFAKLLSK